MHPWTLVEVSHADPAERIDAAARAVERISTAHELGARGYTDLADLREETVVWIHNRKYADRVLLLALPTPDAPVADAVGCLQLGMPTQDDTHLAHLSPTVDPAHARRGVGSALVTAATERARAAGRTTLMAWTMQAGEPGPGEAVLTPPTGIGVVNPQDPSVAFALARGFALEQGERHSLLRLPVAPDLLASLHDDAAARAGEAYRLLTWVGLPPDDALDGLATLYQRMSTDAPSAGLDIGEQRWDADRVRHAFARAEESGYDMVTVVAQHAATGELAAFTQMELSRRDRELAFQGDTLVLREHRGRRLGMLVKTAMLRFLAAGRPELRRVHTWNAAENSYMLDINVALGFAPESVAAGWQLRLTD